MWLKYCTSYFRVSAMPATRSRSRVHAILPANVMLSLVQVPLILQSILFLLFGKYKMNEGSNLLPSKYGDKALSNEKEVPILIFSVPVLSRHPTLDLLFTSRPLCCVCVL